MIIHTVVQENTGRGRRLPFIGDCGQDLRAHETIVLPACYPDACLTPSALENFDNEIKFKGIKVAYITEATVFPVGFLEFPERVFHDGARPLKEPPAEPCPEDTEPVVIVPAQPEPERAPAAIPATMEHERVQKLAKEGQALMRKLGGGFPPEIDTPPDQAEHDDPTQPETFVEETSPPPRGSSAPGIAEPLPMDDPLVTVEKGTPPADESKGTKPRGRGKVTKPKVTKPKVTKPKVTKPKVTGRGRGLGKAPTSSDNADVLSNPPPRKRGRPRKRQKA